MSNPEQHIRRSLRDVHYNDNQYPSSSRGTGRQQGLREVAARQYQYDNSTSNTFYSQDTSSHRYRITEQEALYRNQEAERIRNQMVEAYRQCKEHLQSLNRYYENHQELNYTFKGQEYNQIREAMRMDISSISAINGRVYDVNYVGPLRINGTLAAFPTLPEGDFNTQRNFAVSQTNKYQNFVYNLNCLVQHLNYNISPIERRQTI